MGGHPEGVAATVRKDKWWLEPLATLIVFSSFIVYVTWAAFQGEHYYASPYLSPLYSPLLFVNASAVGAGPLDHTWLGEWPILPFPGIFRFTCYYYRKAYYRAFVGSPPGCAIVPMGKRTGEYKGETRVLIFQNLHRYTFYFALVFIPILYYDSALAFFKDGKFGIGVGTIVLLTNATLLAFYTLGCHAFRHLIGGRRNVMSGGKATLTLGLWRRATWLNERHMPFAWVSLVWVGLTDLYVRLVSMGIIRDFNTWN
jgi:hypothetical protein